ncbi:VOC family protein [Aureimonas sp. AU4]|uniref:VOC family protein n=1 Tax=Aureimonas sp. AU4 TaxID=1638163 RepID=UPI0007854E2C|nr:VOC family protein [Aureimonas sp. AU4]
MTQADIGSHEALGRNPLPAAAPHRIGGVTLVVHDLEAVSRFYRDVIGLQERERGSSHVRLGTQAANLIDLRLDQSARRRSPREAGLFHTAFLLPERADLGAWLSFTAGRCIRLSGASDHSVSEAVYLDDPEGNGVEIYADRPRSVWKRDGNLIHMTTQALDVDSLVRSAQGRDWSGFPDGGEIGHVHLQVGTVAPAESFYRDLLGFDVTCRYPGGTFFGSGGYHHRLAANVWNSAGAPVRTEPTTGLADVEIAVGQDALDAVRGRIGDIDNVVSTTSLTLRDPWNTSVTLKAV